jgi:hypothetical protein
VHLLRPGPLLDQSDAWLGKRRNRPELQVVQVPDQPLMILVGAMIVLLSLRGLVQAFG